MVIVGNQFLRDISIGAKCLQSIEVMFGRIQRSVGEEALEALKEGKRHSENGSARQDEMQATRPSISIRQTVTQSACHVLQVCVEPVVPVRPSSDACGYPCSL